MILRVKSSEVCGNILCNIMAPSCLCQCSILFSFYANEFSICTSVHITSECVAVEMLSSTKLIKNIPVTMQVSD